MKEISGGPKNYAYVTHKRKTVCKVRDITLHHNALKVVNFNTLIKRPPAIERRKFQSKNQQKIIIIRDKIRRQILSKL